MPALETPPAQLGTAAPAFRLPGVDGKMNTLYELKGAKGTLVFFMCNHCPYVQAQLDRIITDMRSLKIMGISVIAINPNDASQYPEDSFENMKKLAREKNLPFPYLFDETQEIAKKYGAVCTPDFFGFNTELKLQYRGRLDNAGMNQIPNPKRELFEAMSQIANTGKATAAQHPSIGCSIKWRANSSLRATA